MNDRGLNLTSTEMLKGYVLSQFNDNAQRKRANDYWKGAIKQLHDYRDKNEDLIFFQAWLRSQYAESIRATGRGAKNQDFENIGTRFHSWVRDNLTKMNLKAKSSESFERFIDKDLRFFYDAYLKILAAEDSLTDGLEHIYFIQQPWGWGIARSLSYALLLAPLTLGDDESIIKQKLNMVARYIEIFTVRRSVNRSTATNPIRKNLNTI